MATTGKSRRAPKKKPAKRRSVAPPGGPVTLAQAKALAASTAPPSSLRRRGTVRRAAAAPKVTPASLGQQRQELKKLCREERDRRTREYQATMKILKARGVNGLTPAPTAGPGTRRRAPGPGAARPQPLQILAEGDSWFEYPAHFFGGIIPRVEKLVGVPILNLAKAGDEVRFMLGVEEREILSNRLKAGSPAGGPWDVLLFSGGGNDIVDNPMALWIRDFNRSTPAADHIIQHRFDAALALVRAGYEDLIAFRDSLSPQTHLIFHAYDFAIPDGRGVCFLGPWLKPAFDSHGFPKTGGVSQEVVKEMLSQFAVMLRDLETRHPRVTTINAQGTLAPVKASWHNELHPSRAGFDEFARIFHERLKALFPGRVL